MDPIQPAGTLPIRTIAALTGVNAMTLRAWERRYGLIRPTRTPKGHRLYSHADVELIRRVVAMTERGMSIGRVREALDAQPRRTPRSPDVWRERLDSMAAAIARFDEPALDEIYEEVLSLHPVEVATRKLLAPLLERLGERWKDLPGAIAEEHFFAVYMRSKLGARLLQRSRLAEGPRLLAACAPGEQHEIGLLLFALEARAAGMRCVLLGADTPLEEVAQAQRRARCDAVVLSVSVAPSREVLERALPRLVRALDVPVFVGGAAAEAARAAIAASGARLVGRDPEDGTRMIRQALRAGAGAA